jgi:DNA-binding NtrC family response regulator
MNISLDERISGIVEKNIKILVVDDEPRIVKVLKRLLKDFTQDVRYFENSTEAKQSIEENEYSLVISDNMMPEISGLELLSQTQRLYPDCQRILLTGATESTQAIKAFNDGTIHRFIPKPWDNDELLGHINEALDKFRQLKHKEIENYVKDKTIDIQAQKYKNTIIELRQLQTQLEMQKVQTAADGIEMPAEIQNLSFLVVEQNEDVRDSIVNTLKKVGVKYCVPAENGEKALDYMARVYPVEVILSNWEMQPMDGLTLLKRIRDRNDIQPKPYFILLTTQEKKQEIALAMQAKVDGYIIKPFKLETLIAQIKHIVEKSGGQISTKPSAIVKRKNHFLIASKDYEMCNAIANVLAAGGIEKISITHTGKAALYILREKRVDILFYHDQLDDPVWRNLSEKMLTQQIKADYLKLIVTGFSKQKLDEQLSHRLTLPVSFLNKPFTTDNIFLSINQLIQGIRLSDFNYSKT